MLETQQFAFSGKEVGKTSFFTLNEKTSHQTEKKTWKIFKHAAPFGEKNTLKINANPKGGSMQPKGWNALPAAGCNTETAKAYCLGIGNNVS